VTIEEMNGYGRELERLLKLRTHPVALKMLKSEDEVPAGAVRPKRDNGQHLAFCQAVSLARRQGLTVAMFKEDHWCFAPLLAYGIMPDPHDDFLDRVKNFPSLPCGTYAGTVLGPLHAVTYQPDVVLVYADAAQLRQLLMGVKTSGDAPVRAEFDPIDSCAYAVVPVLETGEYRIAVPDPGEHARAAASDDEMIFSIPGGKLGTLLAAMQRGEKMARGMPWNDIEMRPDFPRPDFYDRIFKAWGLDTRD
jgi:uncharacterized protein (DUF169 family)